MLVGVYKYSDVDMWEIEVERDGKILILELYPEEIDCLRRILNRHGKFRPDGKLY
jgi:hypothetical protein